ncbi:MAG: hypothetical protein ABIG44_10590 [Planctomycetota bacterium]
MTMSHRINAPTRWAQVGIWTAAATITLLILTAFVVAAVSPPLRGI